MFYSYISTSLIIGSLYGLVALAACIAFRFLNFPDLTLDGSFIVGAAICVTHISKGGSAYEAILLAFCSGFLAGIATSAMYVIGHVNKLFCGILTSMMLYSISIRVLGGANRAIFGFRNIFTPVETSDFGIIGYCIFLWATAAVVVVVLFLNRFGLLMRASGMNYEAASLGIGRQFLLVSAGLAVANGISAFAGAVVAQYQQFADIGMGSGIAIGAFAALFLGESILVIFEHGLRRFKRRFTGQRFGGASVLLGETFACGLGTLLFFGITTAVLYLGLEPSDVKLISALILLVSLLFRRSRFSLLLVPGGPLE